MSIDEKTVEAAVRAYLDYDGPEDDIWGRCGGAMRKALEAAKAPDTDQPKSLQVKGDNFTSAPNHQPDELTASSIEECLAEQDNYAAAMYEISEIVRVARDNPDGLIEFLQINFPKEWGLTKMEHKAILSGAPIKRVNTQTHDCFAAFEAWERGFINTPGERKAKWYNSAMSYARAGWEAAWNVRCPMREYSNQPEIPVSWQPIETAPKGEESVFWLVPDEFYKHSPDQKKYGHPWFGKFNYWKSMYKATHWRKAFDGPDEENHRRRGSDNG